MAGNDQASTPEQQPPDAAAAAGADAAGHSDAQAEAAREAMDRLNESNRVQLEARMLPRKLTAEQVDGVRERLAAYMESQGATVTRIARESGYSASVVSQWLSGHYAGNVEKVAAALNDWMERDARRDRSRQPKDYVKTQVAEDIRTLAYLADKRLCMAAVVVPAGAGKTYVLKALTDELRGVYLYCKPATAREFLLSLALALGWKKGDHATRATLSRWIVETLSGTRRVIFLDEAHQLGKTVGVVRSIHDEAGVPIVMAGTADILDQINDRRDGRGQFSSRTMRYNALDLIRNAEDPRGGGRSGAGGRDLFSVEEVKAFFDSRKIRLAKDALMLLWAIACLPNYGCLRLVERTVEMVFDMDPDSELVKRDDVLLALRTMLGAEAGYLERVADRMAEEDADAVAAARVA
jgi:DNA transposition AAA+ family ATPase